MFLPRAPLPPIILGNKIIVPKEYLIKETQMGFLECTTKYQTYW
jgi:hypothetical protein